MNLFLHHASALLALSVASLSSLQYTTAIYSHYSDCSEFMTGNNEKGSVSLCPTELEEAEVKANSPFLNIIDVIPDFVSADTLKDIQASLAKDSVQANREKHQLYQRFISHVGPKDGEGSNLIESLVVRMRGAAGFLPIADRTTLPTVSVEGRSSVPHIDCYVNDLTNEMEKIIDPINDRVGFLWVGDDSHNAGHFRFADTTIPVRAGSFVHFRADIPHYTVLPKGGSVSMLGPFPLASPKEIGSAAVCVERIPQEPCETVDDCEEADKGTDCIVPGGGRRQLRKNQESTNTNLSVRHLGSKKSTRAPVIEKTCHDNCPL